MSDEPNTQSQWYAPALIGVVAVGLGVFAVVASCKPGANFENRAFIDSATTHEVQADVSAAVTALYTYDPAHVADYADTVRPLLTGSMLCSFDATVAETTQFVTSTETKADVVVDAVGVTDLTESSASTVVSLSSTWSERGTERGSESRQLTVAAEKVDGRWLVADVTDLREPGRSDDCPRSN